MKKKVLLTLMMAVGMLVAKADGYTYLTFETTDGAKVSVPVASLTLNISGTTLTAGSQSFVLSNLSKMYFSNTDYTTGIEAIDNSQLAIDSSTEIYDLQGHKLENSKLSNGELPRGVYIVKTKSRTYKMIVR